MNAAIIGAGRMGRRHIQVAQSLGLNVTGVCDVQAASVADAVREAGLPDSAGFTDVSAMLDRANPACVIVATTAPSHRELTCQAAKVAKYVLCEKPMATSLEDCDAMIEACRASGALLAINHQMRFMEQYSIPKRLTSTPEFGKLASVTVVAGNFGLAMNGSHYFEMFRYMTDEAPATVQAWFSPERVANPRGAQFEDRAGCIRLTTASGTRFYLDASSDQGHGFQVLYGGTYGQVLVDEATGALRHSVRQQEHRSMPTTRYLMPFETSTIDIAPADAVSPTRDVLRALLAGQGFPTGEEGRQAVRVLSAAHLSHELGNIEVTLSDPRLDPTRVFPWA